jgi:hypothetical protein
VRTGWSKGRVAAHSATHLCNLDDAARRAEVGSCGLSWHDNGDA